MLLYYAKFIFSAIYSYVLDWFSNDLILIGAAVDPEANAEKHSGDRIKLISVSPIIFLLTFQRKLDREHFKSNLSFVCELSIMIHRVLYHILLLKCKVYCTLPRIFPPISCFLWDPQCFQAIYCKRQRQRQSAIHPLPHTWADRHTGLVSVTCLTGRENTWPLPLREFSSFGSWRWIIETCFGFSMDRESIPVKQVYDYIRTPIIVHVFYSIQ